MLCHPCWVASAFAKMAVVYMRPFGIISNLEVKAMPCSCHRNCVAVARSTRLPAPTETILMAHSRFDTLGCDRRFFSSSVDVTIQCSTRGESNTRRVASIFPEPVRMMIFCLSRLKVCSRYARSCSSSMPHHKMETYIRAMGVTTLRKPKRAITLFDAPR